MIEKPARIPVTDMPGFAATLAPVVDRLRMSVVQTVFAAGLPAAFLSAELDESSGVMLTYLRNAYPDRVVPRSAVRSVFTYQPEKPVDTDLNALIERGVIVEPQPGMLALTPAGRSCVKELHLRCDAVACRLWSEASAVVAVVGPLVHAVLRAACETGGETFRLMAPDRPPTQVSETGLLAERLTGLRFHRFDAHIAAWQAAGYAAADLPALAEIDRAAIEANTNLRAAVPYAVLTAHERVQLRDGLDGLDGLAPGGSQPSV